MQALRSADDRLLVLGGLSVVGGTALRAACWRRLYGQTPQPVGFLRAWRIVLVAQLLNISIPARVGDFTRIFLISEAGQFPKAAAATSVGLEKLFDMVALLIVLLLASTQTTLPASLASAAVPFGMATAAFALVLIVIGLRAHRVAPMLSVRLARSSGLSRWGWQQAVTVVDSLRILQRGPASAGIQVGYLAVWAALGLAAYLVMAAVGLDLPPAASLVVLVLTQVGTAVPTTPGRVGVFQYLSVLALTPFGTTPDEAFTYGVLFHFVSYGPPLTLGALGLWRELPELRRVGVLQA